MAVKYRLVDGYRLRVRKYEVARSYFRTHPIALWLRVRAQPALVQTIAIREREHFGGQAPVGALTPAGAASNWNDEWVGSISLRRHGWVNDRSVSCVRNVPR
jgi:hypothetical protein